MGGRGASSGSSKLGNKYGSQYHTLLKHGNVKFVSKNKRNSETLMETMTKGRVYAHVEGNDIKSIVYFDNKNKRSKQIDLDHKHKDLIPHVHHGYFHSEKDKSDKSSKLTSKEKKMVENINRIWDNYKKQGK